MNIWSGLNKIWEWLNSAWSDITTLVALDFPDSPGDGDEFGLYRWDASAGVWKFIP